MQRHVRHSRKNTGIGSESRCSTLSVDDNVAKCRSWPVILSSSVILRPDRSIVGCPVRNGLYLRTKGNIPSRSAFVTSFMARHSRRFDGWYEEEIVIARFHTYTYTYVRTYRNTNYVEFIELCVGTRYCTLKRNLS